MVSGIYCIDVKKEFTVTDIYVLDFTGILNFFLTFENY